MSSDTTSISVRGLGKSYRLLTVGHRATTLGEAVVERARHPLRRSGRDSFWALQDVSFDVSSGEAVGIVGRNGAGKSTLLKVLSRITDPTAGEVRIRGRVGSLLEVGTGFHPELTGRENIFLNGSILGMKRREIAGHFDSIVEFAGIGRFLDMPVKRYSSGMSVRLAFAVAAHLEPEILLVDEVLAVGDAEFQSRCLGKMNDVATQDDRTVLFVSHNMAAIEGLCSRCIVLDAGTVVFDGKPVDAISTYISQLKAGDIAGQGEFDLTTRADTDPFERPVLRSVRIAGPSGESVGSVRMGDPLTVIVVVEGLDDVTGASVGMELRSDIDQPLTTFHTQMKPPRRAHVRCHREEMVFELASLPLMPGRYWLTIGVWDPLQNRHADRVERAAHFDVIASDVHRSGYQVKANQRDAGELASVLFVPFDWEVRPARVDGTGLGVSRSPAPEIPAAP
jgi:lipopolysaccharide transport system ATP-binding protein